MQNLLVVMTVTQLTLLTHSFPCFLFRLRLKKEFEVFKNQPEYNSFVREECISSSDEDGRDFEKPMHLPSEQYRKSDQEDSEHVVPRGLWVGGNAFRSSFLVFLRVLYCHNGNTESQC